jgi:hypothetical protein
MIGLAPGLGGCSAAGGDAGDTEVASTSAALIDAGSVAWATVTQSSGVYSIDDGNSRGSGTISVSKLSTGSTVVTFLGMGSRFFDTKKGNVQVVAVGNNDRRCKVVTWADGPPTGPVDSDLVVQVVCHDKSGTKRDSAYNLLYARASTLSKGDGAYVWANDSASSSYSPSSSYAWNATGGAVTAGRLGLGRYFVQFAGQGFTGGTVLVTAYGTGSEYCKIVTWGKGSPSSLQVVNVNCFDTGGNPVDTRYTLNYSRGATSMDGQPGGAGAHVWANDPSSSSYSPAPAYSYTFESNSFNGVNKAGRSATGDYYVRHYLFGSGTPHVTAYGTDANYCKVNNVTSIDNGDPNTFYLRVKTLCFTPAGAAVDTLYVEHLTANLGL